MAFKCHTCFKKKIQVLNLENFYQAIEHLLFPKVFKLEGISIAI